MEVLKSQVDAGKSAIKVTFIHRIDAINEFTSIRQGKKEKA